MTAGKGEKNGLCNRTACQRPLEGEVHWYMRGDFDPKARVYYCQSCAFQFNDWDDRCGEKRRCTREHPLEVSA